MGEDSVTPFVGSSSTESLSSLIEAVTSWVKDGQPIFNNLLNELHQADITLDPMIETFVFSIVGGYTFNFSKAMHDGMSITESHAHSMTLLMQNPRVTQMTEQWLQQHVESQISKVVE